jgi:hypothetical protein
MFHFTSYIQINNKIIQYYFVDKSFILTLSGLMFFPHNHKPKSGKTRSKTAVIAVDMNHWNCSAICNKDFELHASAQEPSRTTGVLRHFTLLPQDTWPR